MSLASPAVTVVSCVAVGPAVDVFLSMLVRHWSWHLLLASTAVPVVSCVADGPAVDVFLQMLFRPWSPCHG
jgi:hypothetical protein